MARKIGIYGGTFDPIHFGHLILAREAIETLGLDEVRFVPAAISPHKPGTRPAPAGLRLEMVRAAVSGEPRFAVDTVDMRMPPPSYSYRTVEEIQKREPDASLYYIIGADNVPLLHTWKNFHLLSTMVRFIVFARESEAPLQSHPYPVISRRIDISSTEIRRRVAEGRSIQFLCPEAVGRMIAESKIYLEP